MAAKERPNQVLQRLARQAGISPQALRMIRQEVYLRGVACLLQALWLEDNSNAITLHAAGDESGTLTIRRAEVALQTRVRGVLRHARFLTSATPILTTRGRHQQLRTPAGFLRALKRVLPATAFAQAAEAIASKFLNSVERGVLEALLARRPSVTVEASPCGAAHYPFPHYNSMRVEALVRCSNQPRRPLPFPLFRISVAQIHGEPEWVATALGTDPYTIAIPVHPWQLQTSEIVRSAIARGSLTPAGHVDGIPLAAQRTIRIPATGFDAKLALGATLLGANRLLPAINVHNAPVVSTICRRLGRKLNASLRVQPDVVAISSQDATLSPHIATILRAPIPLLPSECAIPALHLWPPTTDDHPAAGQDIDWFQVYCNTVMQPVLELFACYGIALEPHLQNTTIIFVSNTPRSIALRDTDSALLHAPRFLPAAMRDARRLHRDTWPAMPSERAAAQRLCHAMIFAHLAEAAAGFARINAQSLRRVISCIDAAWDASLSLPLGPLERDIIASVQQHGSDTRAMLTSGVLSHVNPFAFNSTAKRYAARQKA